MHVKGIIRVLMKLDTSIRDLSNMQMIKVKVMKSKEEYAKLYLL